MPINNGTSAGTVIEVDPQSLHLTGGTLNTNSGITFNSDVYPESPFLTFNVLTEDGYADFGGTIKGGSLEFHDNNGEFNVQLDYFSGLTHDFYGQTININGGGITFPDSTVQTTAGLPLGGGTLSGDVYFDGNLGSQKIRLLPNGYSDNNGDAYSDGAIRVFSQSGHWGLTGDGITLDTNNPDVLERIFLFDIFSKTLVLSDPTDTGNVISISPNNGIQFPDTTIQTTAGIPEAPIDGNAYVRKDGAWVDITTL